MTVVEAEVSVDLKQERERSALGRAQLIIDAFTSDHPVLSLGTLSRRAGLPKSTAHRFAEQMVDLGWLERCHNGYRIGVRLYEMGELCDRRNSLRHAAAPHLVALSARTGLAVNLAVLDHDSVLCLDRVASAGTKMPRMRAARIRFSALNTVLGRAIIAFEDPTDVKRMVVSATEWPDRQSHDDLTASLDLVRARGFAAGFSRHSSVTWVAVPLRNSGRAIASIGIAGVNFDGDVSHVATGLRRTAAAIWQDLFNTR